MSITKEAARQCEAQNDRPEMLAAVKHGLQTFLNSMAASGFELPLEISLHDSDGDVLREFRVEKGGRIVMGNSADATALYVFPLVAVAQDAKGRIAVLKLDAQGTEAVVPKVSVEFVN
jgi:hypothetical protein